MSEIVAFVIGLLLGLAFGALIAFASTASDCKLLNQWHLGSQVFYCEPRIKVKQGESTK